MAHAGWMYQPLNDVWYVVWHVVAAAELLLVIELLVGAAGVSTAGAVVDGDDDDVDVALWMIWFNPDASATFIVADLLDCEFVLLRFDDNGTEFDDESTCVATTCIGDSSCSPSNFSNSFGSLAPGKSCLFANIRMGTPCRKYL